MNKQIFTSIDDAEKFREKKIREGYKVTIVKSSNYITVIYTLKNTG